MEEAREPDSLALSDPVLSKPSISNTVGSVAGAVDPFTATTAEEPEVSPRSAAHDGFEEGSATVAAIVVAV